MKKSKAFIIIGLFILTISMVLFNFEKISLLNIQNKLYSEVDSLRTVLIKTHKDVKNVKDSINLYGMTPELRYRLYILDSINSENVICQFEIRDGYYKLKVRNKNSYYYIPIIIIGLFFMLIGIVLENINIYS